LNVNETLKLSECILSHVKTTPKDYSWYASILDKLYSNLVIKNEKLNEPKLTQSLEFFKMQLEIFLQNQIDKIFHPNLIDTKMLQYRVQILIDRFTDIMGDDEFRHTI
jgi:hypothetical protein